MARNKGRMTFDCTGTINMGFNYPCNVIECFPGDSFRLEMKALLRFLPQVSPTMSNVTATVDTYTVPLRQLCERIGLDWDAYLTGGEDGNQMLETPMITIPESGYDPGGLADWLNYPTNYKDMDTGKKVIVAAGRRYSAFPVIAYMHIINENYRDPNFIKKLDLTKYQEFLDGTYQFETPAGDPIDYDLCVNGLFPKAWSRDYFGRALPNTQRGPQVSLPIGGSADLQPDIIPIKTGLTSTYNGPTMYIWYEETTVSISGIAPSVSGACKISTEKPSNWSEGGVSIVVTPKYTLTSGTVLTNGLQLVNFTGKNNSGLGNHNYVVTANVTNNSCTLTLPNQQTTTGPGGGFTQDLTSNCTIRGSDTYIDLQNVKADLSDATAASILAFRLAARMQRFGEILQNVGARAVEYTLAMFGVRIPDGRVQRPIFHGSFRMPVVFSEVLQTSSTNETSPQGNLAGHGITGGVNSPIHIKVIEHSFVISILNVMPRSQYREFVPAYMFRKNRLDIPVPMMQGIGDQPVKREQIFPNSKNPDESFGFIPQYSDLWYIPSGLHGHMKDTFLHWNMARAYKTEPVLSAKWRYERPTDRSFAVRDEDQMQIQIGFVLKARSQFARNVQPGIRIV